MLTIPQTDLPTHTIDPALVAHWIRRCQQFGGLLILALSWVYLSQLNAVATMGYELQAVKNENQRLLTQLEIKEIAQARPSSIYALRRSDQVHQMRYVGDDVEYINLADPSVAMLTPR